MRHLWRIVSPLILLVWALLTAGCTNLDAVREFADQSSKLGSYQRTLKTAEAYPKELQDLYQLSQLQSPEIHSALNRMIGTAKQSRQQAKYHIALAVSYLRAIGELAGEKLLPDENNIKAIVDSGHQLNFIKAADKTAATKLGASLLNLVSGAARSRSLAKHLEESGDAFDANLIVIDRILTNLDHSLASYETEYQTYYILLKALSHKANKETNPGLLALISRQEMVDMKELTVTRQAIKKMHGVVVDIKKGFSVLQSNRENLADMAILRQLKNYANNIRHGWRAMAELT